jgi:hypothetical protein
MKGGDAEDREEARRDVLAREVLGLAGSGEVEVVAAGKAPISVKDGFRGANRGNSGTRPSISLNSEVVSKIIISRLGSGYASGRRSTPFTTLKMAVFAPMPSASASIATAVKPGFFRNVRNP